MTHCALRICALSLLLSVAGCFQSREAGDSGTEHSAGGGPAGTRAAGGGGRGGKSGDSTDSKPSGGKAGSATVGRTDPRDYDDDDDGDDTETPGLPTKPGACSGDGTCVTPSTTWKADILFVIDNSGSMHQEQATLRDQFPFLLSTLASGARADGRQSAAITDLHLGVVSTDMGLVGIPNNYPGCNTQRHIDGGDDGILLHPGNTGPGCTASYPSFLEFQDGQTDGLRLAQDFGCIAALGTTGCGFEQPLEAALKALWPKNYRDADGNVFPPDHNPILFLSTTPEGKYGHGDTPIELGGNAGFLRNDPGEPLSTLAIIVVTDEEDCSSKSTAHFVSTNDPNDPLSKEGINLRCFYNKQNLFAIERYVKGLQGLRPGNEDTVFFSAIVGVPVELVSAEARDFDYSDDAARDAYYAGILDDARMQERPMNENIPAIANLAPSCTRIDATGDRADAYPPRRIVEVAKGFGRNGSVHSICSDDFGPAIQSIVDLAFSER